MANSLTQNPLLINAQTTQSYKAATLAALGSFQYLLIEKIEWQSPATIADSLLITDNQGNTLLSATCETALQSQIWDWTAKPKRWADFNVPTLASGILRIWLA
jgi:hypothetical protein